MQTAILTAMAMIAFAANSLLCRHALGDQTIDAASFTTVRVTSGALFLALIMIPRWRSRDRAPVEWRSAAMLFTYMVFFSFAYISLSAGTGALLLFGAVQLTMFVVALRRGETFPALSWVGLGLAAAGIVYLVSPGITAPDPVGAGLMIVAGMAWGFYSLLGRSASDPIESSASNFILAVPLALGVSLAFSGDFHITPRGLVLAVASGVIASGLGYVIWYAALRGLQATSAATVQLSVPVIAAIGGVMFLAEEVTPRLVLASFATLGGIALVLLQKTKTSKQT